MSTIICNRSEFFGCDSIYNFPWNPQFWSSTRDPEALRSASTISFTRESKSTWRFQPSIRSALAGLPRRRLAGNKENRVSSDSGGGARQIRGCTYSTSAGRKYLGSTFTTTLPVFASVPSSSTPEPRHLVRHGIRNHATRAGDSYVLDVHAEQGERLLDELADRVRLAGSEHEVFRLRLLQHAPHALDIVARCEGVRREPNSV